MNITLINGSPKSKYSTSGSILHELSNMLDSGAELTELHFLKPGKAVDCFDLLTRCDCMILGFPLYVDGLPSHLLQNLVEIEQRFGGEEGKTKKVYVIINCGFYEGEQCRTAMKMMKNWCLRCGFQFCGGLGVGAGGMWHSIKDVPIGKGPKKNCGRALEVLAETAMEGKPYGAEFVTVNFPRLAYKLAGEQGWRKAAKKNGIKL